MLEGGGSSASGAASRFGTSSLRDGATSSSPSVSTRGADGDTSSSLSVSTRGADGETSSSPRTSTIGAATMGWLGSASFNGGGLTTGSTGWTGAGSTNGTTGFAVTS